jgi:hypothetical protein
MTWADFPNGPENTIFVVEAANPVIWTKPDDLNYDPSAPVPPFGLGFQRPVTFLCRTLKWEQCFTAGFGNGRAQYIRSSTEERVLRALISRYGGEKVDPFTLD